jgi:NAD(P)-dependent dehydrogenase (short-subunit alcohol dehydrogenase family)
VPTALITGASTGIGRTTALRLATSGWRVLAGVRDSDAGESLERAAPGGRVRALTLDVTDPAQIAAAVEQLPERGLDGLVNNAGIGIGGPLEVISDEELRRLFDVNVFAQIAVTRAMLPALRRARGRIVFISSIGGLVAVAYNGPYAASKHAIEAFGDALRGELHSSGIEVALVEPGSVSTPIWEKIRAEAGRVSIPSELEAQYGGVPRVMDKVLADTARRGVPPEKVAATIERALTARRMRARYLVGRDAQAMLALRRLLPDPLFDRLIRSRLGA